MAELSFFVGKGGVGKTTVAAAFAVRIARKNRHDRVLLLSTDPAHSLADIFQLPLKDKPKAVPRAGRLEAWQINSERLFAKFLRKHKENILSIVDAGSIFSREDLEPLLNQALPGIAEVSALLAIHGAMTSGKYSHIVVDTAPFGHTLRLFGLPGNFLRFLDFLELAASRDSVLAQHFGGRTKASPKPSFIAVWKNFSQGVHDALANDAKLFLVTTTEEFSLNESLRCRDALETYSPPMRIDSIVLNRSMSRAGKCKRCRGLAVATRKARMSLKRHFPGRRLYTGEDSGTLIAGVKQLESFANHVFGGRQLREPPSPQKFKVVRMQPCNFPVLETSLAFVLGKGGVGKTTISAALGFAARKTADEAVQICSVDPAPSLDDIFQQPIGDEPVSVLGDLKFQAAEMDSGAIFSNWIQALRENIKDSTGAQISGIHLDLSFERHLLSALLNIVPPGMDEILAIFRILNLLNHSSMKTVIDMAPTGHALELLRMPDRILAWTRPLLKTLAANRTLAGARDAAVKIAELGQRIRELAGVLRARDQTQVHIVLLPELLPDRETERLVADLRRLRLIPKSMFVNRVVFAKDVGSCRRCNRIMQAQQNIMRGLKKKYPGIELYFVRNFPREIAGKSALTALTGELWQLA